MYICVCYIRITYVNKRLGGKADENLEPWRVGDGLNHHEARVIVLLDVDSLLLWCACAGERKELRPPAPSGVSGDAHSPAGRLCCWDNTRRKPQTCRPPHPLVPGYQRRALSRARAGACPALAIHIRWVTGDWPHAWEGAAQCHVYGPRRRERT